VRQLAALSPNSPEGPIAVATAAIEARQFDEARAALEPLIPGRMTQRVATLMARIEGEQHADKGRVREWLARAVNSPRDPAWTADGFVADRWMPVSPVTGALDAFQWRVPVEAVEKSDGEVLASKLEELVALGMARPAVDEPEVGPVIAPHTVEAQVDPAPAPVTEAAQRVEPEMPKAEATKEAAASQGSVPNTARPTAKRTSSTTAPAAAQRARTTDTATSSSRGKKQEPGEARVFTPPHAPDDPGTEAVEADDVTIPLRPQRA
jgi:HemY protein